MRDDTHPAAFEQTDYDADFGAGPCTAGCLDYLDAEQNDADRQQALAEMHVGQCIQAADDAHRNELAEAYDQATAAAPGESVKVGRQIVIDNYGTLTVTTSHWFCCIGVTHYGIGAFAAEAVDQALAALRQAANAVEVA
jgi:hypothetical protein